MMDTLGSHPGVTTYTAKDVRGSLAASGISPNSEVALTVMENLRPLESGESVDDRWNGASVPEYLDAELCGHDYPSEGDETHVAGDPVDMICLASPLGDVGNAELVKAVHATSPGIALSALDLIPDGEHRHGCIVSDGATVKDGIIGAFRLLYRLGDALEAVEAEKAG